MINDIEQKTKKELVEIVKIQMEAYEKLLVESKESVATTLLNAMESAKVEKLHVWMCFSTDRDDGKSIEITCKYLDGKSTTEVMKEMQARIDELEAKKHNA